MQRTYQYRLYPTPEQAETLDIILGQSCLLYNEALEVRRSVWEHSGHSLSYIDLWDRFREDRKERLEDFGLLNAASVQQLFRRQDKAMAAFFRRLKEPGQAGFPRFKAQRRFRSVEYRYGDGCKLKGDTFYVQHIGDMPIKRHRLCPDGMLKQVIITRRLDRWYVSFQGDTGQQPQPPKSGLAVGIDMGLNALLALSCGLLINNPRWLRRSLARLRRVQRSLARKTKESRRYYRVKHQLARLHEKIRNQRKDFWHRLTHKLVEEYALIAIENLTLAFMLQNSKLALSAHDAGLGFFKAMLDYKAESAGCTVIVVDPKNTSQQCSQCGVLVHKGLSQRWHSCPCGCELDRDVNAARNVLNKARCGPTVANAEVGNSALTVESRLL